MGHDEPKGDGHHTAEKGKDNATRPPAEGLAEVPAGGGTQEKAQARTDPDKAVGASDRILEEIRNKGVCDRVIAPSADPPQYHGRDKDRV